MKDGDITDQRPDRRNNDIAEMRERRLGRGKRKEEQRTECKKAEREGCDGKLHSFISFFKNKIFTLLTLLILIFTAISIIRVREVKRCPVLYYCVISSGVNGEILI